jgi:hypothetical protein
MLGSGAGAIHPARCLARTGDQLILEATFVPLKGLWLLFRRRSTRPCLTGG